jgi:hypothetical protein
LGEIGDDRLDGVARRLCGGTAQQRLAARFLGL